MVDSCSSITKSATTTTTTTTVNMRELELAAKNAAIIHITTMFQRPGQLEKVEQYKHRLQRKKASVEAQLKSAMQQQLDSVRSGLNELHQCLDDVNEIDTNLKRMFQLFNDVVPNVCNRLNMVRDENMRHSQYVTARENLKHIFTVPESVEKTKQWINDGKLLHTHQCLRDLENSRDDLLYELHKLPNQSPHDKSMLKAYFSDVETLSNLLEKQLRLILSRTLNTVRKEPTVIVTALRIIEREEKADCEALKQEKQTGGFLPPGRPKNWKQMAFDVLEKSIATRIEGTQIEERTDNKYWLIRYLELIRQLILEDLRVVKTLCIPCFPPRYNILDKYIKMYHECLSKHLQDEIIGNGLEGNEYVTMLSWCLKTYQSDELLQHPDLIQHTRNVSLPPLLSDNVLMKLENDYLTTIETNYMEWMKNTLIAEEQEWRSNIEPFHDDNDNNKADKNDKKMNYMKKTTVATTTTTSAPIIIFQMIDQNLQVAKTISDDLITKVLIISIKQVINYGESYRKSANEFKLKYFEDRNQIPYFTQYMIIIINNCLQFAEQFGTQLFEKNNIQQQQQQYKNTSNLDLNFNKLRTIFTQLRNDCCDYLLEELFLDLDKHFDDLFTIRWLTTTTTTAIPIDTICLTLDDYFQDYNRLNETNYKFVVQQAKYLVLKRYLIALLSKRTSFKTFEECCQAAEKIQKEVQQLVKLFNNLSQCNQQEQQQQQDDGSFDSIIMLSELLKSDDDMLSFELHRVVEKYPDITDDHLLRLLSLRGDLARSDIREKVAHLSTKTKAATTTTTTLSADGSIFKNLVFPKLVNLNVFNN